MKNILEFLLNKPVLFIFIFFLNNLISKDLDIISFFKDKKISLYFNLKDNKAIFKEHIKVYTDNPKIIVKKWEIDQNYELDYISGFNSNKKVYNKNFNINIEFAFLTNNKSEILNLLENLNIYISYFAVTFDDRVVPQFFIYSLANRQKNKQDFFNIDLKNINKNILDYFLSNILTNTFKNNLNKNSNFLNFNKIINTGDLKNNLNNKNNNLRNNLKKENTKLNFYLLIILFLFTLFFLLPFRGNSGFSFFLALILLAIIIPLLVKFLLNNYFNLIARFINK